MTRASFLRPRRVEAAAWVSHFRALVLMMRLILESLAFKLRKWDKILAAFSSGVVPVATVQRAPVPLVRVVEPK
jgi:hypothetical protein